MKVFIVDIETTGLDKKKDQILEVCGGVADTKDEVYGNLQHAFRILIIPKEPIACSPYVLEMHSKSGLWSDLNKYEKLLKTDEAVAVLAERHTFWVVRPDYLKHTLFEIMENIQKCLGVHRLNLGGKNVSFDLGFIGEHDNSFESRFRQRRIDPAILWVKEDDETTPTLEECTARCAVEYGPHPKWVAHTGMSDVEATAWAIRGGFKRLLKNNHSK